MRKKLSLMLVLALVLCMFLNACGNKQENVGSVENQDREETIQTEDETLYTEAESEETEEMTEITEEEQEDLTSEEWQILAQYCDIVKFLDGYAESGEAVSYDSRVNDEHYKGTAGLIRVYQELIDLGDEPQKIAAAKSRDVTNRWGDYYDWDCQKYLDKITAIHDVPVSQTITQTNRDGKVVTKSQISWMYKEDGTLYWDDPYYVVGLLYFDHYGYSFENEFDDSGLLIKTTYYNNGSEVNAATYTYDENGHITHMSTTGGGKALTFSDYDFTCDSEGRVIQVRWGDYRDFTLDYTYDEAGRLIKEEKIESYHGEYINTYEYQYDENGFLSTATYTYRVIGISNKDDCESVDNIEFTCDEQGRVVSVTRTYNDMYYITGENAGSVCSESSVDTVTIVNEYGDYCFYNP